MYSSNANEAKKQCGEMELEPVQISRNGKPEVVSVEDCRMNLQSLQEKIQCARHDITTGNTVAGDAFFAELLEAENN